MKVYTRVEAQKVVDELRDARTAITSADTRWYRRVHAEIFEYASATGRLDEFWFLEDQHTAGLLKADDYYSALVGLLAGDRTLPPSI